MKLFLGLNNRFQKQGDTYIYKPRGYNFLIATFALIIIIIEMLSIVLLAVEDVINGQEKLITLIFTFAICIIVFCFIFIVLNQYFVSISFNEKGSELSWFFYKKKISWDEFKVIKYESYENYTYRMTGRGMTPFPYKGCIIFSVSDFNKKITREPLFYLKKPFSWFYINFYDENDLEKNIWYENQAFVFDEKEFMEFAKEIGLRIQDYPMK